MLVIKDIKLLRWNMLLGNEMNNMKKELLPILEVADLRKTPIEKIDLSKMIVSVSNLISSDVFYDKKTIDSIENISKYIYKKKKKLNISKEVENIITLATLNKLMGTYASIKEEKESTNYYLGKDYDKMSNSFRSIVKKLFEEKHEMSHKALAKSLGWSSANVTKQFKTNTYFRFVKVYKLNSKNIFYSLSDDAVSFLEEKVPSNYVDKIEFFCNYRNKIKLNGSCLDYEIIDYKIGEK